MFRALLAHPQETMQAVYCVRVMSVGCTKIEAEADVELETSDSPRI
jgi:hypothetical protein